MNRQQLLSRMSETFGVVYSNGAWFPWHRASPQWKNASWRGEFSVVHDNVWAESSSKFMVRWPRVHVWDQLVLKSYVRRLKTFLHEQGAKRFIGYVFHPIFAEYVPHLRPDVLVYHAYDLFKLTPGWNRCSHQLERRLVNQADLVIASSAAIAESLEADYGCRPVVLPNGADSRLFASVADALDPEPDDIAAIPRPRIGYTGNLNRKVDFALIESLAIKHSDWQFVFVGALANLDDVTTGAVERCKRLPNIHFLGGKPPKDLAHYVGAMDVNIMCYRIGVGLWTEGVYPLKMHEYLATGIPVVSADIASAREFKHVLACARDREEWDAYLSDALDGHGVGTKESRRAVAIENDWSARARVLKQLLGQSIATNCGSGVL